MLRSMSDIDIEELVRLCGFTTEGRSWYLPDGSPCHQIGRNLLPVLSLDYLLPWGLTKLGGDTSAYTQEVTLYAVANLWGAYIGDFREYELGYSPGEALGKVLLKKLKSVGCAT